MSKVVVTGAGGFIGSHLVDALLERNYQVVGIDSMESGYGAQRKEQNLVQAFDCNRFRLVRLDLASRSAEDEKELAAALEGAKYIFHLAGQPGVRESWGDGFVQYTRNNIDVTQRLLEASRNLGLKRFILASTSSVYGAGRLPMKETDRNTPLSPYGLTKHAAEQLCSLYAVQFGLPTVALRYFTVYGPRQRPDMAFSRFISRARARLPITLYAKGRIERDFTYVSDVVEGTLLAAVHGQIGQVYNIGSGQGHSLRSVVDQLGHILGRGIDLHLSPKTPDGDMSRTLADIRKARLQLGYAPKVELTQGLENQVRWSYEIREG